jgi:hypothetical protein
MRGRFAVEGVSELSEVVAVDHRDRRPERPGRRRDAFRMVGNVVYCGLLGLLVVIMLILGVGYASSAGQRSYSGTFHEHSCEYSRFGCEGVGTWVSDNGSIVKKKIQLDGFVNSDGTVRASYTPTGFNNDAQNNIVHASTWAFARFWLPWALTLLFAGLVFFRVRGIRRYVRRRRALSRRD